jgi:uncharacterized coiled-coil protein SlyX
LNSLSYESGQSSKKIDGEYLKHSPTAFLSNSYELQLRQKEGEIKNLQYELEVRETKITIDEKTIKELNNKINSSQKSVGNTRIEFENKVSKY